MTFTFYLNKIKGNERLTIMKFECEMGVVLDIACWKVT